MINKKTLDKIQALELLHFAEDQRFTELRYEYEEKVKGRVGGDVGVVEYYEQLKKLEGPAFFMMSCVATRVIDEQHVTDEGVETMTAHWEWDYESMEIFKDGVAWAVANGLEIPE